MIKDFGVFSISFNKPAIMKLVWGDGGCE